MAGYIGSKAVSVNTTSATISDDLAVGDDVLLTSDGAILKIGNDADLQLTHSGSAGTITNATGDLTFDVAGDIILNADGGDIKLQDGSNSIANFTFENSGDFAVININNNKDIIFRGNDGGADVNALTLDMSDAGSANFNHDAIFGDNGKAIFGASSDLVIYHDGSNSYVQDGGTGQLRIDTNGTDVRITKTDSEYMAKFITDGGVELYYNNAKKFETKTGGVEVTGLTNLRESAQGGFGLDLRHSSNQTDSGTAPYGMNLFYSAAAPDSSVAHFFVAGDNASGNTTRFAVRSDGDVINHDNAYGAISDQRIKQDITDANSQWDDIKAVRVRNFKKKDDVRQYGDEAWEQIGVIAQELEAVSPKIISKSTPSAADITSHSDFGTLYTSDDQEVIDEEKSVGEVKEIKEDVKQVKYSVLYMKAIKALQEAMTRIETLEAKVAVLEG